MWFFKTGPGQYGEGDKFLGLNTPQMRGISKKYRDLPLKEVQQLIKSPYHEERSIAIQISVYQFPKNPEQIYNFYLENTEYINNWDLVDISAPKIVGVYLSDKPRDILYQLTKSDNLWERRIAIISCMYFIVKQNDPADALKISQILLSDKHDLIHKAVGWMLREVGKRCSQKTLTDFLDEYGKVIPRTSLRYAIERFPEPLRRRYLHR
ncbi:MAG: alkylation repair enzyme protein [Candidatus Amesbacteria bacterium GW2011_GWB1_47_19]|nr:MAG: alkylation repair enzyme protein [Candidatus Amesbacteria bacterium GW2011_GWA1_44_24]KKU32077.1 MAG: alkylation repair enzyme protein [Candidatus Amesbacteria bacterium GW2011_GWC1_46_24]KKU67761.1 MAG: alkylation repair enzyme protein [Candidatus Amesbacteria bacterium GW2011_GWB1_47_19]